VIAAHVVAVDTMASAAKELTRHGVLVAGRDGGMVRNPASIVHAQYSGLVDRLASSLGLTPDARSRMRRSTDTEAARSDELSMADFFVNGPAS
jgi:P27 family predicted phage terminase small subunit